MSWFDIFRSLWAPSKRSGKAVYILDAGRLADSGGRGEKISPRDQVQVLQQLARFAKQEAIRIQAVFEGKVLREVEEDGGEFNGIVVFFADKSGGVPEILIRQAKKELGRGSVTVVSSDRALEEKIIALGAEVMRIATFRKGMEGGSAPSNGGDRFSRPSRHGRRQRPTFPSRNRDREQPKEPQKDQSPAPAAESQPPATEADATVRNLIDLVE